MRNLYLLLCFFILAGAKAQSSFNISGTINNDKTYLQNVNIQLLNAKDSSLAKVDLSNTQGQYNFENIALGNYIILFQNILFETYYSKPIILDKNIVQDIVAIKKSNTIKEITINGKKPMIEIKSDKMVFNIENNINATGSTAMEMLKKSPGVVVDKDDNIALRGKNGVRIYVDGKPSYLDQKDLAAMLKTMQAADLESIEMITNPGSKYDASGNAGIINIKLKKNRKFGTNGSVSANYSTWVYNRYNTDISLNHRNEKINVFGTLGLGRQKQYGFVNFDRIQDDTRFDQTSKNITNNLNANLKLGADYFINSKSTIGFLVNTMGSQEKFDNDSRAKIGKPDSIFTSYLLAKNNSNGSRINNNYNLNYKYEDTLGRSFNVDADYGRFNSTNKTYQPNYYTTPQEVILSSSNFRNNTPTVINIFSIKADYEQNMFKGKVGFGIKSAVVNTDNDFKFYDALPNGDTLNTKRSNHFNYNENVNAAYANYSRQVNKKISFQTGLRAEQTISLGELTDTKNVILKSVPRQYINLFPTANISYAPSDMHAFSLSYSKRIDRPNYQDLNPFENKLDELTYQKGNAFLRPQYTNNFELGYTFMQFANASLSYARTRDLFMQITDTTESTRTFLTYKNFATQDVVGLNIGSPLPIRKWWMGYLNISLTNIALKANLEGRILNNNYLNYNIYMNHDITLPRDYALNISGWYNGPSYWGGIFKTKPMGSLDLGLQKQFLNKKLTVRAAISDVLFTSTWRAIVNFGGMNMTGSGNEESRQVKLGITYRFGSNTIKSARNRDTGASKETDRIKSGK
jgi:iron complex outermembrane recepter protein